MAHYIWHGADFEYIGEKSSYCHNYYRNIHTGEVILEVYNEDCCGHYFNIGKSPTFSETDMDTAIDMGSGEYGKSLSDETFQSDTEWE